MSAAKTTSRQSGGTKRKVFTGRERELWVNVAQESDASAAASRAGVQPATIRKWARNLGVSISKPPSLGSLPALIAFQISGAVRSDVDAPVEANLAEAFEDISDAVDRMYDSARDGVSGVGSLFEYGGSVAESDGAKLLRPDRLADLVEGAYNSFCPQIDDDCKDDPKSNWVDDAGREQLRRGVLSQYPEASEEARLICDTAVTFAEQIAEGATVDGINHRYSMDSAHALVDGTFLIGADVDHIDEAWFRDALTHIVYCRTGCVLRWDEAEDIVRQSMERITFSER